MIVDRDARRCCCTAPDLHEEQGSRSVVLVTVKDAGLSRDDLMVRVSYGPVDALGKAVNETWDKSVFSLMLGKMVTGEVSGATCPGRSP